MQLVCEVADVASVTIPGEITARLPIGDPAWELELFRINHHRFAVGSVEVDLQFAWVTSEPVLPAP